MELAGAQQQGPAGRKRLPHRERPAAEDEALNQIAREAEARLAAKRAARAEAREIRMKELERQQKEIYQVQKVSDEDERMSVGSRGSLRPSEYSYYLGSGSRASSRASSARASPVVEERPEKDFERGVRTVSSLSAATLASLGGTSSRRGSGDTSISIDTEASIREIKDINELKDQIQDVEGKYMQGLKEMKDSLAEVEEKYKKAMVSNAQLDNEKTNFMYQVDALKDALLELEEQLAESRRQYEERNKDFEREKHAHGILQFQFMEVKEVLKNREELLAEIRQLQQKQEGYNREISDLQETIEWKEKKIGALERQKEFFDSIRSERDDLREEVNILKEQLKKHGIIPSSEVTTNGETSGDRLSDSSTIVPVTNHVVKVAEDGTLGRAIEMEMKNESLENVRKREILQNTEQEEHREENKEMEIVQECLDTKKLLADGNVETEKITEGKVVSALSLNSGLEEPAKNLSVRVPGNVCSLKNSDVAELRGEGGVLGNTPEVKEANAENIEHGSVVNKSDNQNNIADPCIDANQETNIVSEVLSQPLNKEKQKDVLVDEPGTNNNEAFEQTLDFVTKNPMEISSPLEPLNKEKQKDVLVDEPGTNNNEAFEQTLDFVTKNPMETFSPLEPLNKEKQKDVLVDEPGTNNNEAFEQTLVFVTKNPMETSSPLEPLNKEKQKDILVDEPGTNNNEAFEQTLDFVTKNPMETSSPLEPLNEEKQKDILVDEPGTNNNEAFEQTLDFVTKNPMETSNLLESPISADDTSTNTPRPNDEHPCDARESTENKSDLERELAEGEGSFELTDNAEWNKKNTNKAKEKNVTENDVLQQETKEIAPSAEKGETLCTSENVQAEFVEEQKQVKMEESQSMSLKHDLLVEEEQNEQEARESEINTGKSQAKKTKEGEALLGALDADSEKNEQHTTKEKITEETVVESAHFTEKAVVDSVPQSECLVHDERILEDDREIKSEFIPDGKTQADISAAHEELAKEDHGEDIPTQVKYEPTGEQCAEEQEVEIIQEPAIITITEHTEEAAQGNKVDENPRKAEDMHDTVPDIRDAFCVESRKADFSVREEKPESEDEDATEEYHEAIDFNEPPSGEFNTADRNVNEGDEEEKNNQTEETGGAAEEATQNVLRDDYDNEDKDKEHVAEDDNEQTYQSSMNKVINESILTEGDENIQEENQKESEKAEHLQMDPSIAVSTKAPCEMLSGTNGNLLDETNTKEIAEQQKNLGRRVDESQEEAQVTRKGKGKSREDCVIS
ncbi:leucine-rich repeat flightless-interacting protein 1 isoform X4 [Eublepharis macularius]|uniref:Leucine-rich repeat flightless-interacting protein 1 isoform X4 n=1 Tax=Eublepharis macularius TaxID=481883 RepID=A0AA97IVA0_EUBMA|nr:leucine-rich repeat flightless-interacting protein 1 isoform X4 [Eublepharis macularius]